MLFSKEDIEKFKRIYKKNEGKDISDERARELTSSLILMFKAIYRPIPKKDKKIVKELSKPSINKK